MHFLNLHPWLVLLLTLLLSTGSALALLPVARRWGWVDHPVGRKVHERETPLVGGVAVFLALAVGVVVSPPAEPAAGTFVLALLAGGCVMLITGLVDDLRHLGTSLRFLVQIAVCLLLIDHTGIRLEDLGRLFSGSVLGLGVMAVPVTVFAAMGVINAFNLIDGLDGLSGAMFLVAACGMTWFASQAGQQAVASLLLLAIAAVAGFMLVNARLPWNASARVFLGDAGSLMLGFLLAWCFISLGSGSSQAFMPMTAVWLFAIPLLDTSTLMWIRWRQGRSAFAADQNHLHHAFLRAGFSVREAWLAMTAISIVMAGAGVAFELARVPDYISFYVFMLCAFSYYFYIKHSWASQRFLGRRFISPYPAAGEGVEGRAPAHGTKSQSKLEDGSS